MNSWGSVVLMVLFLVSVIVSRWWHKMGRSMLLYVKVGSCLSSARVPQGMWDRVELSCMIAWYQSASCDYSMLQFECRM